MDIMIKVGDEVVEITNIEAEWSTFKYDETAIRTAKFIVDIIRALKDKQRPTILSAI